MAQSQPFAGYFRSGIPYNRVGHEPRNLVIFQGLLFENKPQPPLMAGIFNSYYCSLEADYTTYIALRKPGLPAGYSMRDMSDDYAAMILEQFGDPVDIIGVSTGGSIAQHFAADHPDLVRKLVIHSSAYVLSNSTKEIQLRVAALASQRRWSAAYAAMFGPVVSNRGAWRHIAVPVVWIASFFAGTFGAPADPSDLVVTVEAEDKHNFKDRLAQITAPTLVVAGDRDPFYSPALFRETAEGIPNARLILYPGMGHPAGGKQFRRDVLMFLKEAVEK